MTLKIDMSVVLYVRSTCPLFRYLCVTKTRLYIVGAKYFETFKEERNEGNNKVPPRAIFETLCAKQLQLRIISLFLKI